MTTIRPLELPTLKPMNALDPNVYATKKTIAQGMLDVALLTANASQLKYLLQMGHEHEFFVLLISLLGLSIFLQIVIGILILIKSQYNINQENQQRMAEGFNNMIVCLVFSITLINVFITAFGIDPDLYTRNMNRLLKNKTISTMNNDVVVGCLLLIVGYINFNEEKNQKNLNIVNNIATIAVFLISLINVVIAGFGLKGS